jgi:hypothetical protein
MFDRIHARTQVPATTELIGHDLAQNVANVSAGLGNLFMRPQASNPGSGFFNLKVKTLYEQIR